METIEIKGLKEKVYYEKLPSGLDVYLWENEKSSSFFVSLNVKYGSIHTDFKLEGDKKNYSLPNGIAHFLEHLNFNLKGGGSAYDLFDKLGTDINAFTTFEYTSYHLTGTNNLEENIKYLLDYVFTPYFTKKLVNNERGIILEEAKMGLDNPGNVFFYKKYENTLFKDKRNKKIIGSLDDIKNISIDDIKLVYENFYHPENMFMVVTGNIDAYKSLLYIKEQMNSKEFKKYKHPQVMKIKEPNKVVKEFEEIEGNVEIPLVSVCIKIPKKKIPEKTKNNILLSTILKSNFGASSEFKNDLIEKKLVTNLSFSRNIVTDNLIINIDASTKYPEEVVKLIREKLNNLEITKEDFERKKRASIASLVFLYDDAEEVNANIQDDIIYSKDHEIISDIKDIYDNLTYEEAKELLSNICLDNISVLIMKPKKK